MRRTFAEHAIRPVMSLDGLWALTPHDGSSKTYPAYVPGVWERIPDLADFHGTADYARTVTLPADGHYLLRMGAVSHTGDVYFDGAHVGHHYNAFTGFDILLKDVPAGEHALRVTVDNTFGEHSALHIPNDYYTYGGVTRSVELHRVGKVYAKRLAFHAIKEGNGIYTAHVKVFLHAIENVAATEDARLLLTLADETRILPLGALTEGEDRVMDVSLRVTDVIEWDVLAPRLYSLTAEIALGGAVIDDLTDRVGFRTVEICGERILLNRKEVFLKGFNRHEDHGLFGCALPVSAMMDDLARITGMGCNTVRTCHYPNDPKFLDLCDELGLLVWEEHHARAIPIEILRTETYRQQQRACNQEMVSQHGNHPCIYIWGVMNECESETQEGRAIYAEHLAHLRQLDPTRPVSFASCRIFTDISMDLADVCSFNIYPKWYVNESVQQYSDRLLAWMDTAGAAGKPILITEVGAGGIYGYHDPFGKAKWSEERQCEILEEQLTALLVNRRISGVYVWQFADVRVAEEWWYSRPKTMNNKGVVDQFRQPKMSYATVKRIFNESER